MTIVKNFVLFLGKVILIFALLGSGTYLIITNLPQFTEKKDDLDQITPPSSNSSVLKSAASSKTGQERPIFNLYLANGETKPITDLDQYVILIQFITQDCTICFDQIRILEQIFQQAVFQDQGRFAVVLMHKGGNSELSWYDAKLSSFAKENFILASDEIDLYNVFIGQENFDSARVIINIDSKVTNIDTQLEDYQTLYAKIKDLIS